MAVAETADRAKDLVTAEELWALSTGGKKYELVKGELVEMTPPGGTHGKTAVRLSTRLQTFVEAKQLGEVMVESGYRLTSQPDTVRGPDISFLAAQNMPAEGLPEDYIPGAPDLAVEIVSPGDTAAEVQEKVQDYLTHGTRLVWIVYPRQRVVIVHYPDGMAKTLHPHDMLNGEEVIPGFTCRVGDIFS